MTVAPTSTADGSTQLYRGSVQPGENVAQPGSIVILGNVEKGATVVAGGDVIVWGELQGEVHAGADGDVGAIIAALRLLPTALSIADSVYQQADDAGLDAEPNLPRMASLDPETGAFLLRPATDPSLFVAPAGAAGVDPWGGLARFSGAAGLLFGVALLVSPVAVLGIIHASDTSLVGALVEVGVYGYLLLQGANLLSDGSELLLEVVDPGIIGGLVLPILGAVPDSLIIAASGLGTDRDAARESVQVGIGTLAGSTVALLTIAWGGSVLVGRCNLDERGRAIPRTLTRGWDLLRTGISTDDDVRAGALAMILSVLLYGFVQIPAFLGDVEDPTAALAGAAACAITLIAYCAYSIINPELQKRKIVAARQKRARMFALSGLAQRAEPFGALLLPDGSVNREAVNQLFDSFDADGNGFIDSGELRGLMLGLALPVEAAVDAERDVELWMKEFDIGGDAKIDKPEFEVALTRWIEEKRALAAPATKRAWGSFTPAPAVAVEAPLSLLTEISSELLPPLTIGEEAEEEGDEGAGEAPLTDAQIVTRAIVKLAGGVGLCAIFSDPLVDALSNLSQATGIPPFFVAFTLTPLASNASELVSSLKFAAKKRPRNISLTFSQVYGAVTMNNTLCLGLFLLVIYKQQLDWVYSSEVTVIVGSTLLVGLLGLSGTTFKSYWGLVSLAIYPLSLLTVWGLDTYLGWQ